MTFKNCGLGLKPYRVVGVAGSIDSKIRNNVVFGALVEMEVCHVFT